ncbi:hypothetical protein ABPG73_018756 [Tetrahymena malaccensis]
MHQNQQLNNQNYVPIQFSKSLQDENKAKENSQTSLNSAKKSPFFKVTQVSVVDILKGDDQVSVLSLSKITQNNMNQISQNYVQVQSQCMDSSHTQDSQQCSKLIEEEFSITYKTEKDPEIQIDCNEDQSNQKAKETENEVQKQSFTQIIGQLIKKKRKNNIELQYINQKDIWKKKWLGVLFYVSKFLYIAKQCQKVFRASLLTSFQLHLIGDTSSDFEQNESFSKIDLQYFFKRTHLLLLQNYIGIISLFLLFSGSLFYGHLFACIWYYVGTQSEQGWINSNQLEISNIYSNYICSYYYAVVTMTTIGYGDITAKTTEERSVMIFLALLSCGIFGFTINSIGKIEISLSKNQYRPLFIGNILSDFKQKSDMYLTELGKLNKYLSFYQVSSQIQINARKYLKFVHQEKNKDQLSTFQSLNNLSDYLQNQIKMEVISKKLKQIQFFKNMLKEETILQLSLQVKESIYQPEQVILGQSEVKEPAIYIINHGKVLKYSQYDLTAKENSIVVKQSIFSNLLLNLPFILNNKKELKEKENFGLIEFFMNKENSNFNYKSKELTSIFSLELSSFLKIIKQDDESYEKFCYIRDQVIYQQYLSQVNYSCLSCQSKNHTLKECPCIFYNERHLSIIKKSLQKDQEFQDKKRKAKKKQNCWQLFDQINSKAIDFQNDNVNQLSFNECSQITEEDEEEEEEEEQQYDSNKNLCVEGIEKLEIEGRKSLFSQNLLKISEDRDNFISHKTGEVLNEDDCPIGKIGSELKPQVMIQPRKYHTYDFQKSEEMKKQNSNIIENQQDDDYFRHGRMVSLNSQKNIGQLNQPYANNLFNNNNNNNNNSNNIIIIQSLVQSLKDFQNFIQQNQTSQKTASLKQGNISRLNSKRLDTSSFNYNLKKEHSSSFNGSNRNIKQQKQPSITIFEQKDQIQKQQQQQIEIHEEDLDKLQIFKIYYPKSLFITSIKTKYSCKQAFSIIMMNQRDSLVLTNSICSQIDKPYIKIKQLSQLDYLGGDDDYIGGSFTRNSSNICKQSCNNFLSKIPTLQNSSNIIQISYSERVLEQEHQMINLADNIIQDKQREQLEVDMQDNQSAAEDDELEIQEEKSQRKQSQGLTLVSKQRRKHIIELEGEQSKLSWQKNWLIILYYISKIKRRALQTQKLFRHELLTAQQLKLIGDQTVNVEKLKQIEKYNFQRLMSYRKFNKLFKYKTYRQLKVKIKMYFSNVPLLLLNINTIYNKFIDYAFSSLPLFNYLSNFYVAWQALIFISSFANFIYLPFEFSFNIQRSVYFQNYITFICPIIYSFDILINANTVSFQQGSHVSVHKQVIKKYLRGQFISDFISLLCLNITFMEYKAFYFLFFLRFSNSFLILDIFREKFFSRTQVSGIISLVLLFMSSLFIAHLFACFWYYIGTQSSQGWIKFYQLDTSDIYTNYIYSYYFVIVTMTTIGYGDITAKTTQERLVMIFFTLISCGIFGYIINSIGNILADIKQKSDQYLTELAKLNQYFKKYQVSLSLQANVRRYLQFKYKEGIQDQISAVQSLNNLSQHLQNQIKMDVVSRELKQIDFLKQICKEETFFQLSLEVQEKIYQPDQIILDQNDIKEPSIYIINYGRVLKNSQYDLSSKINEIIELKEKERFGVIEFFMNLETSKFNYKSMELTSVYSLNLSSFLKVIQQDNEIYEKFCFLRDQVVFQKSLYLVKHLCESCKSISHNLKECPCIFYKSRKLAIIKKYQQDKFNNLHKVNRRQKRTTNTLFLKKYIEPEAISFQQNNINQLSFYDNSQSSVEDQNFFSSQKILISSINNNTPNNNKHNDNQGFKLNQYFENQQTEQNEIDKIVIDVKSPLIVQRKKHENDKCLNDDLKNIQSFQKLEIIEEEERNNSKQVLGLQQQSVIRNNHASLTSILENASKNDQVSILQAIHKNIKDIFKILQDENVALQFQKKLVSQQQINNSNYKKTELLLTSQKQLKVPQQQDASFTNTRIHFQNQLQNKQHKIISEYFCEELDKMNKPTNQLFAQFYIDEIGILNDEKDYDQLISELEDSKHIELEISQQNSENDSIQKVQQIVKLFAENTQAISLSISYNQQVQKDIFDQWIQMYENNNYLQNFTVNISNSDFPLNLRCSKSLKVQLNSLSILLSPKEIKIQISRDHKIQLEMEEKDQMNRKLDISFQRVVSVDTLSFVLEQFNSCQNLQIQQIGSFIFSQNSLELSNFDSNLIKILQKHVKIEELIIKNLTKMDQEIQDSLIGLIQQQIIIKSVKIVSNKLQLSNLKGLLAYLEQQKISFSFELYEGSGRANFESQKFQIKISDNKQVSKEIWESFLLPLAAKIEKQIEIFANELRLEQLIKFLEYQDSTKNIHFRTLNNELKIENSEIIYNLSSINQEQATFLLNKIASQQFISITINKIDDAIQLFNQLQKLNYQNTKIFNMKLLTKGCRQEGLYLFKMISQSKNIEQIQINIDTNIFSIKKEEPQITYKQMHQQDQTKKVYLYIPSVPLQQEEVNVICDFLKLQENSNFVIESISSNLSQSDKVISYKSYTQISDVLKNKQCICQVNVNNYSFYRENGIIQINNLDKLDILVNLNFLDAQKIEITNINIKDSLSLWTKIIQDMLKQAENTLQSLTLNFGMNMKKYLIDFQQVLQLPQIQFITISYQGDQGLVLDIPKKNLELTNCGINNFKLAITKCRVQQLSYLINHKEVLSLEEVNIIKSLDLQSLVIERLSAPFHEKFSHTFYKSLEEHFLELIKHCFEKLQSCNIKYANNLIIFDKSIQLSRVEINSETILNILPIIQITNNFKFKIKNFLNEDIFGNLLIFLKSQALNKCKKIYLTLKTSLSQLSQLIEYLDTLNLETDLTISQISQNISKEEASNIGKLLHQSKNVVKFVINVPNMNDAQIIEIAGDKQKIYLSINTPAYFDNKIDSNHFIFDFLSQFQYCTTLKIPFFKQPQQNDRQNSALILHDVCLLLSQKLFLLKSVQLFPDQVYQSKLQNKIMSMIFYKHLLVNRQVSYLIKKLKQVNFLGLNRPEKIFDLTEFIQTQPQHTNFRLN